MRSNPINVTEPLGLPESQLRAAGAWWTAREIEQQPQTLRLTHALVRDLRERIDAFVEPIASDPGARIVLAGAGTSAYIGQCLAPLLDTRLPAQVDAIATTDIVSAPSLYLNAKRPLLLVSFGRSGNSPESLAALKLVEARVRDARHLRVTCNPEGALARAQARKTMTLLLPEQTHDFSFAMTSSFSCMMYATLAAFSGAGEMDGRIGPIAQATERMVRDMPARMQALASHRYERVVYLGSGLLQGLAREAALKLGELSNGAVATCFDTPLGFRHGPKTFVNERTLAMVFVSNDPLTRRYDYDLIDELRRDGCAAQVIEISAQPRAGVDAADTIAVPGVESAADVDLLWPYVAIAQIYAFQVSIARGLSPDNPNRQGTVNRVVQGVRLHSSAP